MLSRSHLWFLAIFCFLSFLPASEAADTVVIKVPTTIEGSEVRTESYACSPVEPEEEGLAETLSGALCDSDEEVGGPIETFQCKFKSSYDKDSYERNKNLINYKNFKVAEEKKTGIAPFSCDVVCSCLFVSKTFVDPCKAKGLSRPYNNIGCPDARSSATYTVANELLLPIEDKRSACEALALNHKEGEPEVRCPALCEKKLGKGDESFKGQCCVKSEPEAPSPMDEVEQSFDQPSSFSENNFRWN